MHGEGSYTWPNGQQFDGNYAHGKRSGLGIMTLPDGTVREGTCEGDGFVGEVLERYPNGALYQGGHSGGRRQGTGTMTYANGKVQLTSPSATDRCPIVLRCRTLCQCLIRALLWNHRQATSTVGCSTKASAMVRGR
jgi:hypothetical protein